MPLYIGSVKITGDRAANTDSLVQEVLSLPAISIRARQDERVTANNTWIILQREFLSASKADLLRDGIHFLGTKGVASCLALYITTREDCILAHIDSANTFYAPLAQIFAQLKSKDQIEVKLAGGQAASSPKFVERILSVLLKLSEQFGCDIRITAQYLWGLNQMSAQAEIERYLADRMRRKLKLLYLRLFREPMSEQLLVNLNYERFQSASDMDLNEIRSFFGLLNVMRPLVDVSFYEQVKAVILPELFSKPDQKYFTILAEALFSKQGYEIIQYAYREILTGLDRLRDFAFSVQSGEIILIDPTLFCPYEYYRALALIARLQARSPDDPRLIYVVHTDPCFPHLMPFDSEFLGQCRGVDSVIQTGSVINLTDFEARLAKTFCLELNIPSIDEICEIIQSADYALALRMCLPDAALKIYVEAHELFKGQRYMPAFEKFRMATVIFMQKKEGASLEVARCYSAIASCFRDLKQLEKALIFAERAHLLLLELGAKGSESLPAINKKLEDIKAKIASLMLDSVGAVSLALPGSGQSLCCS